MVEHYVANVAVTGSNPVTRSFWRKNENTPFIDRYKLNLSRRTGDVLGRKELSSRNESALIRSGTTIFVPMPGIELLKDYLQLKERAWQQRKIMS